jgi:hypothetical protein
MKGAPVQVGIAVLHAARREIGLDTDNRLDIPGAAGTVKINHAEHGAMIGNGQRLHAKLFGPVHQFLNLAQTIQQ